MAIHTLNGIALFAGIGGLELGLRTFDDRINTVCYVEGEAFTVASTIAKMEKGILDEAPIWSNVKTFNGHAWRGKVDWISAGFPCQPFSRAGNQKKTDDERWIWGDIIRIINEVRPKFIFLENVSAFTNSKRGMSTVLRTLAQSGFNAEWECFKAKDVGANHHRNRFFLFAYGSKPTMADYDCYGCHYGRNEVKISGERFTKKGQLARNESIKCGSNVADSEIMLSDGFNDNIGNSIESETESKSGNGSWEENVSDPNGSRLKEQRRQISNGSQYIPIKCSNWWQIEPPLGRLADGVPHRVDSLRAAGNGVVPLQAAYAFHVLTTKAGFRFGGE